jgi:hypothetical protein
MTIISEVNMLRWWMIARYHAMVDSLAISTMRIQTAVLNGCASIIEKAVKK